MNKKLQAHSAIFFANTIFGLGVPVTKLLLDEWGVEVREVMRSHYDGIGGYFSDEW